MKRNIRHETTNTNRQQQTGTKEQLKQNINKESAHTKTNINKLTDKT